MMKYGIFYDQKIKSKYGGCIVELSEDLWIKNVENRSVQTLEKMFGWL